MADPQNEKSADYTQEHELITSAARISAILRPLINKPTLLTASIPNSSSFYNTALLKIDSDNGILRFDELNPRDGHDLLLKTKRISIHMAHDGVEFNFTTNLIHVGTDRDIEYYEFEFPQEMRYLQRRETYRVSVSAANEIAIKITAKNKNTFHGELHDISTGGMCIRFPKKKDVPLNIENEEVQCIITLLDKKQVKCSFNICHTSLDKTTNRLFVGGYFIQLDKIQRRAIEKFVAELQRKTQRRMSR